MIEVVAPGPLATVQDLGRTGWAHLGVGRSGAADRAALSLANRLVGNHAGAAAIEATLGGLAVRALDAVTVAVTGARCGGFDWGVAVTLAAGAVVSLGVPVVGLRSYLAVRGGLDAPAVLGSRSTDTLGGLGPAPLRAGDLLPVGRVHRPPTGVSAVPALADRPIRVVVGPRDDWFVPGAVALLVGSSWTVRPESDRVGVRLDGPRLVRAAGGELPSEATLPGALQVPPEGRPILLGPDSPVTGGYPVVAVVCDADLDAAFQKRPGEVLRFRT